MKSDGLLDHLAQAIFDYIDKPKKTLVPLSGSTSEYEIVDDKWQGAVAMPFPFYHPDVNDVNEIIPFLEHIAGERNVDWDIGLDMKAFKLMVYLANKDVVPFFTLRYNDAKVVKS